MFFTLLQIWHHIYYLLVIQKTPQKLCWRNSIGRKEVVKYSRRYCYWTQEMQSDFFRDIENKSKTTYIRAMEERKFVFHWKFRLFHVIIRSMSTTNLTNVGVGWIKALMEAARKRVSSFTRVYTGKAVYWQETSNKTSSFPVCYSTARCKITSRPCHEILNQVLQREDNVHTGWKNPAVEEAEEGHKCLRIHAESRNEKT